MRQFDFQHWKISEETQGLLFFAQCMEEMLFHHGHDSLKVPALNFRHICVELSSTISKIEEGVIDKGNLKPLLEELRHSYNEDYLAKTIWGDNFNSLFYEKNAEGEIDRKSINLNDTKIGEDSSLKRIKRVINYVIKELEIDNRYYNILLENIKNMILKQSFDNSDFDIIYKLTRTFLTDLINGGYSQEYIYWVVNDVFYNKKRNVHDVEDTLALFWDYFDGKQKDYTVILPLKISEIKKQIVKFSDIVVCNNDENYFGNSCKWTISLRVNAMDRYAAHTKAIDRIVYLSSLMQYGNHRSRKYEADASIIVIDGEDNKYEIKTPITIMKRGTSMSYSYDYEKIIEMANNFDFSPNKFTNIIGLHSMAINSKDVGNQLLNLWTIIEVLIPTERKDNFAKINQLCNAITTTLNSKYIYSLTEQLCSDLVHCVSETLSEQLTNVHKGSSDVEKIAAILALEEYKDVKNNIVNDLSAYPLLKYRMELYSNIFSSRKNIKEYLTSHRKRVTWHIMRIYRNRNMIVHDGSYFPYIDIIIQNLHHYVDELIDTISSYAGKGYSSMETIFTGIQQNEYKYVLLLEEKMPNGTEKNIGDDFVKVVFGY